ncbi:MAG: type II toxin-antitoxin system YafQ family toxin [Coriobacteriales bacterium]|nr:type II toxin-antitoxin system YafQ family toxin [Coriobacteriales bacterium]
MKYKLRYTKKFSNDLKRLKKQGKSFEKLDAVTSALTNGQKLDKKYKDHALTGMYKGFRDCHIEPDWILIYRKNKTTITLTLMRTGSHSELKVD